MALELAEGGASYADAAQQLIEAHARQQQRISAQQRVLPSGDGVGYSHDDPSVTRGRMADALYSRMTGREPAPESRQYRGLSIVGLARERLTASGMNTRFLSDSEVVDHAIRNVGLHTTSDFPVLLPQSGNRALLDAYESAASAFKTVARRSDAPDFRPLSRVRFGGFPALVEVPEHGEVTVGTSAEAAESYSVKTYARSFGLSRQALVNDDLSAFGDFARLAGRAAAEAEANVFITLLAQNSGAGSTMADTKALFHADHGNLAGSGAAISVTTLSTARKAIRDQKGLDGATPIGGTPRYLVVGTAKETEAEQVLATLLPQQVSSVNPFSGSLSLLVEPRLSGNVWYVFCDPGELPVLEYAFLQGQAGPQLKAHDQANVLGIVFQVVHDFGAGAVDHRGCYKNAGA